MSADEKGAGPRDAEDRRHMTEASELSPTIGDRESGDSRKDSPDYDASIAFLRWWGGPWCLTAIGTEKKGTLTRTFSVESEARAWIQEQGASRNLYFTPNALRSAMNKKPSKSDVAAVVALHVDVDPRAGEDVAREQERILGLLRDRLPPGVPPPSCIVFSGGGYQAFWKLREPVSVNGEPEAIERYTRQLETLFGADSTHNVDRVMRLPGTVNRPDAKKVAKGRVPALARVVEQHDDRVYELSDFVPAPEAKAQRAAIDAKPVADVMNDPRLANVTDLCRVVIVQGCDPDDPARFASRSEAQFFVSCELVRAGVDDETHLAILMDEAFGISASVREKGRKYAIRQVERARERVGDFHVDKNGEPYPTPANVRIAIARLGVLLEHDEFADRSLISGLPDFGPHLDDHAVNRLWLAVEEQFRLRVGRDRFWSIVQDTAMQARRHPVREYLDALGWDGVPRIDRWLVDYMGAEDSEFVRAVGAIVLVAAVRRVRMPGCKFDEMLVLEGAQGSQKSSALAALAVRPDWFSDDLPLNAKAQEFIESTTGRWIVEAGELKGMRKGDVESLKSSLSRSVDRARMAYGRLPLERRRQFVIVGTTNSDRYLRDNTGNRRFWPVRTGEVRLEKLTADRDQLWAEAVAREKEGGSIRLDPALWGAAAEQQEDRRVEDPYVERLRDKLGDRQGALLTDDVFSLLAIPTSMRTQDQNQRIGDAMRELGWLRKRLRHGGEPRWHYARGSDKRLRLNVDHLGAVCDILDEEPDDGVF